MVKYPQVTVSLIGGNGNAFAILGACQKAAKRAGLTVEQIKEFRDDATSGDYNKLLSTCIRYFNVE
jgi:hypothetical protein